MSYDRSPSSRHNLNSLLSPHSNKSGADGDAAQRQESPYQQQHQSSYVVSDNAYRQAAPYQSPQPRQQPTQPQREDYARYDSRYGYPHRDTTADPGDYSASGYNQYAYSDAHSSSYPQGQAPASSHTGYSDYRENYGRTEYDYGDAAARGQSQQYHYQQPQAPAYDYDYNQSRHGHDAHRTYDRSSYVRDDANRQQEQQPYTYDSQTASHPTEDYYARRYDYSSVQAYAQDPAGASVVDPNHHAQQQQQPSSSAVYYENQRHYDYRQDTIPHEHAAAYEPPEYAPEQGYEIPTHPGGASELQSYRYSAANAQAYSPYKHHRSHEAVVMHNDGSHPRYRQSPVPTAYHTNVDYDASPHTASSHVYQRESSAYGAASGYPIDPYANERMVYADKKDTPRRSTGIGITSLLSEAPAASPPRGSRTPIAGYDDRYQYGEYRGHGQYDRDYAGHVDGYRRSHDRGAYADTYTEPQHGVMSISQLVAGDTNTDSEKLPSSVHRADNGYDYGGQMHGEAPVGAAYDLRTPPPHHTSEQAISTPIPKGYGAPIRGTEFSPEVPLSRHHGQWISQPGLAGQNDVIVLSDSEHRMPSHARDSEAFLQARDGAALEIVSDDDSRPLAIRSDVMDKTVDEYAKPPSKRRRQGQRAGGRRSANAAKAAIAATAANDAISDVATDDGNVNIPDSAMANAKGAGRRRQPRRSRGTKKVELSHDYVYDDEKDGADGSDADDIPLEQSTANLDSHRYLHGSPGDQEVVAALIPSDHGHPGSRHLPEDYSVDEHVQAYIYHVQQRNERAIAKYEEHARRKSQRMHEYVLQRYGPYLRGYFENVGENGEGYGEEYLQDRMHPREDEYDMSEQQRELMSSGRVRYSGEYRNGNGYLDDDMEGSPFGVSNGRLQPPPMGYFTPSMPLSPGGYDAGYGRDRTPGSATSEPLAYLTQEELERSYIEKIELQEASGRNALWSRLAVEQVPRAFRHLQANLQVRNANMRKVIQLCQREVRRVYGPAPTRTSQLNPHQPIIVQRPPKELIMRAKRGMREMLMFWKRHEKEEREMRKRAEREAAEKQKQEEEAREARRQARKLNFLITQTELYSHFIGNKISEGVNLTKADEKTKESAGASGIAKEFKSIDFDEADDAALAAHARQSAQNALAQQQAQTREFDTVRSKQHTRNSGGKDKGELDVGESQDANVADVLDTMDLQEPELIAGTEIPQPRMLMCQLKEYQLKGLSWLANLYEQGINGILADEMGLGKTVQSISLLAYLAETHNIWGPFMVVAPASTLHNWQQELARFVPEFKVLPYWGSQKDRKVLRKSLWNPTSLSRKDSAFHVLVTSYQLVVSDEPYLNRVKWQYMVLDEAQAIKSSSSARWKTLLGFHCRNRLLLTGTPIQNSMQELWALLHFIMPTLFDSHEEFSEWFSRDIESHAENRTDLNKHQLYRLHMILKPFMLRRNKRHVQHELGEKIEHLVPCDLTQRQKVMYRGLMSKISVPELLERLQSGAGHGNKDDSDESLMNLVMQFRKVCSHPELFERAEVESPFMLGNFPTTGSLSREGDELSCIYATRSIVSLPLPKIVYRELLEVPNMPSQHQSLLNKLSLWTPQHIAEDCSPTGLFGLLRICAPSISYAVSAFSSQLAERLDELDEEEARSAAYNQYKLMLHADSNYNSKKDTSALNAIQPGGVLHALTSVFTPHNLDVSPNLNGLAKITEKEFCTSYMSLISPAYKPYVVSPPVDLVIEDRSATWETEDFMLRNQLSKRITCGRNTMDDWTRPFRSQGLTDIWMPSMDKLIRYSGKMAVLDRLLSRLKQEGHRVLLYFQMTKMIDLFEEYLAYRKYTYLRLDGSSKISDRRDMVMDWQTRDDIFIFLLSTRAGGLGINLTAADTVIFFESDWNPTVDSQAMDRAHRLGQTKQVVVYRLITRGTVEERILQRARQKDEIHRIVIAGGDARHAASAAEAGADAGTEGAGEGTASGSGAIPEGFSSNFEPSSKEIVSLLLGETADDESVSRSERLFMTRQAQQTSNHIYGSGGYPGMLDIASLDSLRLDDNGEDNTDIWDKVVLLPPPNIDATYIEHSRGGRVSRHIPVNRLDGIFDTAIQEQIIEKERQQRQQRQRLRGTGRGGKRGGGVQREKRKPRASAAGVKKENSNSGSKAGSRADTPEPSSKRIRTATTPTAAADNTKSTNGSSAVSTALTPSEGETAEATPASAATTVAI
ncbi:putative DNA helicase ino80 [Coemansia spiralis]|uniref:Chromatin-remodeling ATPase INO80 n=2 Tax=Coemansia TaxID=4863 RepID=A0A9W8G2B1_9FUNG|nr:putative DNA helicase ino80 [Coemansia umbellata]KAJ2623422.1 putative DNA helicase ino80 [Coemansia sp. RSA 1358]KAJ2670701.1 putative DNA helicase ino80 [Coemansia spiralis]